MLNARGLAWLACLVAGWLLLPASAWAQAAPRWLSDPLGAPDTAWRYSAALDQLGDGAQAEALRHLLLQRHLAVLAGDAPSGADMPVADAIRAGQALPTAPEDRVLQRRWADTVVAAMQPGLPATPPPVPAELEADAARLREAGPGLWTLLAPDGSVRARLWWLLLRNQGTAALPLGEFTVLVPADAPQLDLQCTLPRYQELRLAAPGRDTAYLCRANAAARPEGWDALVATLREGRIPNVRLQPTDLADVGAVQRLVLRLEAAQKAAADALAAGVSPVRATPASAPASVAAPARAASRPAPHPWTERLQWAGAGLLALLVYGLASALGGRRAGIFSCWALLTALALALAFLGRRGVPAPGAMLAAMVVPAFATGAVVIVYELLFGERFGVLRLLAQRVAGPLVDDVVERLFGRRY